MNIYQKTKNNKKGIRKLDGVGTDPRVIRFFASLRQAESFDSLLYSKGRISRKFFTEDSGLYISPKQAELIKNGAKLNMQPGIFDGLSSRAVRRYRAYRPGQKDVLYVQYVNLVQKYVDMERRIKEGAGNFAGQLSFAKVYNLSIIGAIVLGMLTMSFVYQYFGLSASARSEKNSALTQKAQEQELIINSNNVAKEEAEAGEKEEEWSKEEEEEYIKQMTSYLENAEKEKTEKEVKEMVKGYPIEKMLPYIMEKDHIVAAFMISIAKKESNWGKRVPVLDGQDCYNYWGYRGQRRLMGSGGHTCFNSRKDAVDTVAKRIQWLVENKKLNTPEKMVIWKCGSNCDVTGGQAAARKWIDDVNMYFKKLNKSDHKDDIL